MAGAVSFWRLERRDALGRNPVIVDMTARVTELGPFVVAGNGSCLEGSLAGVARDLPLRPRDVVTLQTSDDGTGWTAAYAGVVVTSAPEFALDAGACRLEGLERRVREAEVRAFSYASGDAASVARQAVLDVVAGGQLGDAVVYDANVMPDAGASVPAVRPDYASLGDLLDRLAASAPGCEWGVDARRRVFFRVPAGTIDVEGPQWVPADASELVTAVRWLLRASDLPAYSSSSGARVIDAAGRRDARLRTHLSQDAALQSAHGVSVRALPAPPDLLWLRQLAPTAIEVTAGTLYSGGPAALADGNPDTSVIVTPAGASAPYSAAVIVDFAGRGSTPVDGLVARVTGSSVWSVRVQQETAGPGSSVADVLENDGRGATIRGLDGTFLSSDYQKVFFGAWTGRLLVTVTTGAPASVMIAELFPVVVDAAFLDALARAHYRAPAASAGAGWLPGVVLPAASARVTRRLPDGTLASATLPVASLEYRLSGPDAGTTVRLGQREDAARLARAARAALVAERASERAVRFAASRG